MKLNWTFATKWIDDTHVLLSFNSDNKDYDVLMSTVEYVHFMELQQHFAMQFKEKIDSNMIKAYNE
jgi:hypothetical protein